MKINFHHRNITGSPVITIIGMIAAVVLPYISEKVDSTTIGGSIVIAVVGALAGKKSGE